MSAKVRPFVWHVKREEGVPSVTFAGSFEGDLFVLKVGDLTAETVIIDRGSDQFGEYAYIRPLTYSHGTQKLSITEELDGRNEPRTHFVLEDERDGVSAFSLNAAGNEDSSSDAPGVDLPQSSTRWKR